MKKACLINPILFSSQVLRTRSLRSNLSMSYFPPLGLAYIAGVLERNGIDVQIIDRNVLMRKFGSDLESVNRACKEKIEIFSPDYVGVTSTTPTFMDVKKNITPLVKDIDSNIQVVLGGPHASALPEYALASNKNLDMVCRGEGEITMIEILSGKDLAEICGLSYRRGSRIMHNPDRPPHKNIDEFYPPARHLLDMESYCEPGPYVMHGLYMGATTILTSRGCPYHCTFCAGKVALGPGVRYQADELVIDEMLSMVDQYKVEGLYFADDMFEANKKRVRHICEMMIEKGLHKRVKWIAQVRANTIDEGILGIMKEAGCVRLEFGFETGSQKVLDILKKRTTVRQNYRAAKIAKAVGLPFQANIIVGMPGEDVGDFIKTRRFMRDIKAHWIGFGEFVPLPGSQLFNELLKQNKVTIEAVERLEGFNFTNMGDVDFERNIRKTKTTIVMPTRIRSFLLDNLKTKEGRKFIFRFLLLSMKRYFLSLLSAVPSGKSG